MLGFVLRLFSNRLINSSRFGLLSAPTATLISRHWTKRSRGTGSGVSPLYTQRGSCRRVFNQSRTKTGLRRILIGKDGLRVNEYTLKDRLFMTKLRSSLHKMMKRPILSSLEASETCNSSWCGAGSYKWTVSRRTSPCGRNRRSRML